MGEIHQFRKNTDPEKYAGAISVNFSMNTNTDGYGRPVSSNAAGRIRLSHTKPIGVRLCSDKPASAFARMMWIESAPSQGAVSFIVMTMPGIFIGHLDFYSTPSRDFICCYVGIDKSSSPDHILLDWAGQVEVVNKLYL